MTALSLSRSGEERSDHPSSSGRGGIVRTMTKRYTFTGFLFAPLLLDVLADVSKILSLFILSKSMTTFQNGNLAKTIHFTWRRTAESPTLIHLIINHSERDETTATTDYNVNRP